MVRNVAFYLIGLGIGLAVIFALKPKQNDSIYKAERNNYIERIKKDSITIAGLKGQKDTVIKLMYRDKIIYKTIYEKIPFSSTPDRDNAFDTLLSN